jgi:hypothetical protein
MEQCLINAAVTGNWLSLSGYAGDLNGSMQHHLI